MRLRTIVLVLISLALQVPLAPRSSADACNKKRMDDLSVVTECSVVEPGSRATVRHGQRRDARPPPKYAQIITVVNGQVCTKSVTPPAAKPPFAPGSPGAESWNRLVQSHPRCPRQASRADAEQAARSFLTTLPLPKPRPYIAPGYALTGKLAYLETRADERQEHSTTTPFGPLHVVVTRTAYEVDWGDGSGADKGPFPFPGEPWPNGRITHTYTRAGRYDVRVTEHWQADWTLGPVSGTITGLRSAPATIAGFEARQLQAVRNR